MLKDTDKFCTECGAKVDKSYSNGINYDSSTNPIQTNDFNMQSMNANGGINYSNNTTNESIKTNRNNTGVIVGIVIAVFVFLVAVIIGTIYILKYAKISVSDKGVNVNIDTTIDLAKSDTPSVTQKSSSNTSTKKSTGYSKRIGDYTFIIPDDIEAEDLSINQVSLIDKNNEWEGVMYVEKLPFDELKNNKNKFVSTLANLGLNGTNINEKSYGGVDFITLEFRNEIMNAVLGAAKLSSDYSVIFIMYSEDNKINYNLLNEVAPIISSGKLN